MNIYYIMSQFCKGPSQRFIFKIILWETNLKDKTLLVTFKKHSCFQKCTTLKIQKTFQIWFSNLKFKSPLPHKNGVYIFLKSCNLLYKEKNIKNDFFAMIQNCYHF
jgi:hypothetical protein